MSTMLGLAAALTVTLAAAWPQTLLGDYGPVGAGTLALIVLWRLVIAPELREARQESRATAEIIAAAVAGAKAAAEACRETARLIQPRSMSRHPIDQEAQS